MGKAYYSTSECVFGSRTADSFLEVVGLEQRWVGWGNGVPWYTWRHVVKLDPERPLSDAALATVLGCGTEAILIGGSSGVTHENTWALLGRVRERGLPVALEVSSPALAAPGADLYLIPSVLNTADAGWVVGRHAAVAAMLGDIIPWNLLLPEAYIVLNPESTVARLTGADCALDDVGVAGYAALAGQLWRLPLVYVEYSGMYGNPQTVFSIRRAAGPARVFYGGGIDSGATAAAMGAVADTIVVGNLVYTAPERLAETVAALRR